MPNENENITLEFPLNGLKLDLGTTATFDDISGFLDSSRITTNGEPIDDKIAGIEAEVELKANASDVYDKTYMDGIFEQIDNAFTGVNTELDRKSVV